MTDGARGQPCGKRTGYEGCPLLLVGHSHWNHSWDTPTWSKLTGAPLVGSISTCLQAAAQGVAGAQCRRVSGGEKIPLGDGMRVRRGGTSFGGASQEQTPGEGGNGRFDHGSPGITVLTAPLSVGVGGFGGPGVLGGSFPAGTRIPTASSSSRSTRRTEAAAPRNAAHA